MNKQKKKTPLITYIIYVGLMAIIVCLAMIAVAKPPAIPIPTTKPTFIYHAIFNNTNYGVVDGHTYIIYCLYSEDYLLPTPMNNSYLKDYLNGVLIAVFLNKGIGAEYKPYKISSQLSVYSVNLTDGDTIQIQNKTIIQVILNITKTSCLSSAEINLQQ